MKKMWIVLAVFSLLLITASCGEKNAVEPQTEKETYTIVSTMRQDSLKGLISVESPLGKALLHHKTGDKVLIHVSADYSYEAVIRKIEESEDAASASLRKY